MDSDTVRNVAKTEVTHNIGPSNTNGLTADLRQQYENQRAYEEKLKQASTK
jgi:hypothetical protein